MSERSSKNDREILERIYRRQLEEYEASLTAATSQAGEAESSRDRAVSAWVSAVAEVGRLEGKIAGLRKLALQDGIDL